MRDTAYTSCPNVDYLNSSIAKFNLPQGLAKVTVRYKRGSFRRVVDFPGCERVSQTHGTQAISHQPGPISKSTATDVIILLPGRNQSLLPIFTHIILPLPTFLTVLTTVKRTFIILVEIEDKFLK